jgi:hypothetical protein
MASRVTAGGAHRGGRPHAQLRIAGGLAGDLQQQRIPRGQHGVGRNQAGQRHHGVFHHHDASLQLGGRGHVALEGALRQHVQAQVHVVHHRRGWPWLPSLTSR